MFSFKSYRTHWTMEKRLASVEQIHVMLQRLFASEQLLAQIATVRDPLDVFIGHMSCQTLFPVELIATPCAFERNIFGVNGICVSIQSEQMPSNISETDT